MSNKARVNATNKTSNVNTTNNVAATEKKIDNNTLDNAKALLMANVTNVSKEGIESNIYTFLHLTDERQLAKEERNNSKFMRAYRTKLRNKLESFFAKFEQIKKNSEINNLKINVVAEILKSENIMEDFMTFYKRFYKLNDFSAASVANNQRIEKVKDTMLIIKNYFLEVEKLNSKK